jgi:uncharacterized protein YodC (DUF2158 family)
MNTGDVVKLKSGGPSMTIVAFDGSMAECLWFSTDHHLQKDSFPIEVVEQVKHDIPYTRSGIPPL